MGKFREKFHIRMTLFHWSLGITVIALCIKDYNLYQNTSSYTETRDSAVGWGTMQEPEDRGFDSR
jgi:hypothetical protein